MSGSLGKASLDIVINKKSIANQFMEGFEDARKKIDGKTITYQIASDDKQLQLIKEKIESLSPELRAGVSINFSEDQFKQKLEGLNKYSGKQATQIGKEFSKSLNQAIPKNISEKQLAELFFGKGTQIKKFSGVIRGLRNSFNENFDINKVGSLQELEDYSKILKGLQVSLSGIGNKIPEGFSSVSLTKLREGVNSQLTSILENAGSVIQLKSPEWMVELNDLANRDWSKITSFLNELKEGLNVDSSSSKTTANIDGITKKIEEQTKQLEKAKKEAAEYQQMLSNSTDLTQLKKKVLDATKKYENDWSEETTKNLQQTVQKYIGLGGKLSDFSSNDQRDIRTYYKGTAEDYLEGYIPIENIKNIATSAEEANKRVNELESSIANLNKQKNQMSNGDGGFITGVVSDNGTGIKDQSKEVEKLENLLGQSKQQLIDITSQYNEQKNLIQGLEKEQKKLEGFNNPKVLESNDYKSITTELESAKNSANSLQQMLDSSNSQIDKLTSELNAYKTNDVVPTEQFTDAKNQIESLQNQLEQLNSVIENTNKKMTEIKNKARSLETENASLSSNNIEKSEINKQQKEQISNLEEINKKLEENQNKYQTLLKTIEELDRKQRKVMDGDSSIYAYNKAVENVNYNNGKNTPEGFVNFDYLDQVKKKLNQAKVSQEDLTKAAVYYNEYLKQGGTEKIFVGKTDITDKLIAQYKELSQLATNEGTISIENADRYVRGTAKKLASMREELDAIKQENKELENQIKLQQEVVQVEAAMNKTKTSNAKTSKTKNNQKTMTRSELLEQWKKDHSEKSTSKTKESTSTIDTTILSTSTASVQSELQALEKLQKKINEITIALNEKTNAIKAEEVQMDLSVNSEVSKLGELVAKIDELKEKLNEQLKLNIDVPDVEEETHNDQQLLGQSPTLLDDNENVTHNIIEEQKALGELELAFRGVEGSVQGFMSTSGRLATFFTNSPYLARQYADALGGVYQAQVALGNSLEIQGKGRDWNEIEYLGDGSDEASVKITKLRQDIDLLYDKLSRLNVPGTGLGGAVEFSRGDYSYLIRCFEDMGTEYNSYIDAVEKGNIIEKQADENAKQLMIQLYELEKAYKTISDAKDNMYGIHTTDEFAELAKLNGYDSVIFRDIKDSFDKLSRLTDVGVIFDERQVADVKLVNNQIDSLIQKLDRIKVSSLDLPMNIELPKGIEKLVDGSFANSLTGEVFSDLEEALKSLKELKAEGNQNFALPGDDTNTDVETLEILEVLDSIEEQEVAVIEKTKEMYRAFNFSRGVEGKDGISWFGDDIADISTYLDNIRTNKDAVAKLVADTSKFLQIDAKGSSWDQIFYNGELHTTEEIAEMAKQLGYLGVEFKNIQDNYNGLGAGNIFAIFDSNIIKEAVEYTDEFRLKADSIQKVFDYGTEALYKFSGQSVKIYDEARNAFDKVVEDYKKGLLSIEESYAKIDSITSDLLSTSQLNQSSVLSGDSTAPAIEEQQKLQEEMKETQREAVTTQDILKDSLKYAMEIQSPGGLDQEVIDWKASEGDDVSGFITKEQAVENLNSDLSVLTQNGSEGLNKLKERANELETSLSSVSEAVNRISKMSTIKGVPYDNFADEATEISKRLATLYDEGITDSEEFVALQYKIMKLFDKESKSAGGVKGSGANSAAELRSWIMNSWARQNADFDSNTIVDIIWGRKNGATSVIDETNGKLISMKDIVATISNYGKSGWMSFDQDTNKLKELNTIIEYVEKNLTTLQQIGQKGIVPEANQTPLSSGTYINDSIEESIELQNNLGREIDENNTKISQGTKLIDEQNKHLTDIKGLKHYTDEIFDSFDSNIFGSGIGENRLGNAAYFFDEKNMSDWQDIGEYSKYLTTWSANQVNLFDQAMGFTEDQIEHIIKEFYSDIDEDMQGDYKYSFENMFKDMDLYEFKSMFNVNLEDVMKSLGYDAIKSSSGEYAFYNTDKLVREVQVYDNEANKLIEVNNKVAQSIKETSSISENSNSMKETFQVNAESSEMDKIATATDEAVQAKKEFATANEGVQDSVDGSKSKLQLEAELMKSIAENARKAADAKKEFATANDGVQDSLSSTSSNSSNKSNNQGKSKIEGTELSVILNQTEQDYDDIVEAARKANPALGETVKVVQKLKRVGDGLFAQSFIVSDDNGTTATVNKNGKYYMGSNVVRDEVKVAKEQKEQKRIQEKRDKETWDAAVKSQQQIAKETQKQTEAQQKKWEASNKEQQDYISKKQESEAIERNKTAYQELLDTIQKYSDVSKRIAKNETFDGDLELANKLEDKILELQKNPILFSTQISESERKLVNLFDQLDVIEKKVQKKNENASKKNQKSDEEILLGLYKEQIQAQKDLNALKKDEDNSGLTQEQQAYKESLLDSIKDREYGIQQLTEAVELTEELKGKQAELSKLQKEQVSNSNKKSNNNDVDIKQLAKIQILHDKYLNTLKERKMLETKKENGDIDASDQERLNQLVEVQKQYEEQINAELNDELNNVTKIQNVLTKIEKYRQQGWEDIDLKESTIKGNRLDDPTVSDGVKQRISNSLSSTESLMNSIAKNKADISGFDDLFANTADKVEKLNERLKTGSITFADYEKQVNNLVSSLNQVVEVLDKDADVETGKKKMKEYINALSEGEAKIIDVGTDKNGVSKMTGEWLNKETKMVQKVTLSYDELSKQIKNLGVVNKESMSGTEKWLKGLGERFSNLSQYLLSFVSFYEIWAQIKQGITYVREFDTALTEMRKVSDETVASLENFQKESFELANSVGTTAQQIQNSTADWMRLGETLEEASQSAQEANILLNVSEFDSIDSATESLVAMSQAYDELEKMEIIDVLNNIGK